MRDLLADAEEVLLARVALTVDVEPAVPGRVPVAVEAHERLLELLHELVLLRGELREGDKPHKAQRAATVVTGRAPWAF